ncbi:MAG TPA: YIP1 family protein [Gaiellaceae bacterium]
MATEATTAATDERAWLLRALLVLIDPRPVFAALRDDSDPASHARQEAVTALVLLAGVASVLWTPAAGRLLDQPEIDGLLVAVWAFLGGGVFGVIVYWAAGAALHGGLRAAGGAGSFRRARHLLAYAAAPVALSLAVWPVRLAVYGGDVFRAGGSDTGIGNDVFVALQLGCATWALVLLAVGVRTIHGWTWPRALEGLSLAAAIAALVVVGVRVL